MSPIPVENQVFMRPQRLCPPNIYSFTLFYLLFLLCNWAFYAFLGDKTWDNAGNRVASGAKVHGLDLSLSLTEIKAFGHETHPPIYLHHDFRLHFFPIIKFL